MQRVGVILQVDLQVLVQIPEAGIDKMDGGDMVGIHGTEEVLEWQHQIEVLGQLCHLLLGEVNVPSCN